MAYSDISPEVVPFRTQLNEFGKRLAKRWSEWLLYLQYARMVRVLYEMPDHVLEKAGISRDEIPAYAKRLIYTDE